LLRKYSEDTWPGHQLEASKKQHEILCKRLKAKKVILHTILLGVGASVYTSHTNHLKELSLDAQKAHKTSLQLRAHSVLYAHKLTTTRCTLEISSRSQGLGLEQGALVILQILTSSSFSLVEETHVTLRANVSPFP